MKPGYASHQAFLLVTQIKETNEERQEIWILELPDTRSLIKLCITHSCKKRDWRKLEIWMQ